MNLPLRPRHFRGTTYDDPCNCAIVAALKEVFGKTKITEDIDKVVINHRVFPHTPYDENYFRKDWAKAHSLGFTGSEVLRVIRIPYLREPRAVIRKGGLLK